MLRAKHMNCVSRAYPLCSNVEFVAMQTNWGIRHLNTKLTANQ
ncbi:Uncharacterised protein [Brucella anthropi]|nr:Uncharacterised protein [Brucella anthropi]